jgi:hypothetical protein
MEAQEDHDEMRILQVGGDVWQDGIPMENLLMLV